VWRISQKSWSSIISEGGILSEFDAIFVEWVAPLFVSIVLIVIDDTLDEGDDDAVDSGCGGDRGVDILLFSVNCTGNMRLIGTDVGRDIDSVVTGGVVVVIIVTVDVEKLVHYDWV